MRILCSGVAALFLLSACAAPVADDAELRSVIVEPIDETRFGVQIEAVNVDGYELARCAGAAYANSLLDEDGNRLFDVFVRDGGRIVDEFRLKEGVREQTALGVQIYRLVGPDENTVADHDGRDVMAVDLQLAECEKQNLPNTLGEE